jgi:hypothetical protein
MQRSNMEELKKNLSNMLDQMDVPAMRKEINANNLHWLGRNFAIRNGGHKNFMPAVSYIKKLLTMMGEKKPLISGE